MLLFVIIWVYLIIHRLSLQSIQIGLVVWVIPDGSVVKNVSMLFSKTPSSSRCFCQIISPSNIEHYYIQAHISKCNTSSEGSKFLWWVTSNLACHVDDLALDFENLTALLSFQALLKRKLCILLRCKIAQLWTSYWQFNMEFVTFQTLAVCDDMALDFTYKWSSPRSDRPNTSDPWGFELWSWCTSGSWYFRYTSLG